jgi:LUD domain
MEVVLPRIDQPLLEALAARGFEPHAVESGAAARALVLSLLPSGALVSTGGSTTLEEIGLLDALRASTHVRYGNLEWLAEDDAERRLEVRKRNVIFADAFVGSVQAVARTGQVVGCDAMGTRQGPYVWGPARVIWVVGANKLVPDLDSAIRRVYQVAFPLEDVRAREAEGVPGSGVNKLVIYEREPVPGRTTIVLVGEALGY